MSNSEISLEMLGDGIRCQVLQGDVLGAGDRGDRFLVPPVPRQFPGQTPKNIADYNLEWYIISQVRGISIDMTG